MIKAPGGGRVVLEAGEPHDQICCLEGALWLLWRECTGEPNSQKWGEPLEAGAAAQGRPDSGLPYRPGREARDKWTDSRVNSTSITIFFIFLII